MQPLDQKTQEMVDMWNKGMSSTEIGKVLGKTRNSVIGVLHRLRDKGYYIEKKVVPWNKDEKPKQKIQEVKTNSGWRRRKITFVPKDNFVQTEGVTLLDLTPTSCRFIIHTESRRGPLFCGQPKDKISYCAHHYRMCYYPVRKR